MEEETDVLARAGMVLYSMVILFPTATPLLRKPEGL